MTGEMRWSKSDSGITILIFTAKQRPYLISSTRTENQTKLTLSTTSFFFYVAPPNHIFFPDTSHSFITKTNKTTYSHCTSFTITLFPTQTHFKYPQILHPFSLDYSISDRILLLRPSAPKLVHKLPSAVPVIPLHVFLVIHVLFVHPSLRFLRIEQSSAARKSFSNTP